jgi:hypothetical protein
MKFVQGTRVKGDRWACEVCKEKYPVPILARDCENKHLDQKLAEAKAQR